MRASGCPQGPYQTRAVGRICAAALSGEKSYEHRRSVGQIWKKHISGAQGCAIRLLAAAGRGFRNALLQELIRQLQTGIRSRCEADHILRDRRNGVIEGLSNAGRLQAGLHDKSQDVACGVDIFGRRALRGQSAGELDQICRLVGTFRRSLEVSAEKGKR